MGHYGCACRPCAQGLASFEIPGSFHGEKASFAGEAGLDAEGVLMA